MKFGEEGVEDKILAIIIDYTVRFDDKNNHDIGGNVIIICTEEGVRGLKFGRYKHPLLPYL